MNRIKEFIITNRKVLTITATAVLVVIIALAAALLIKKANDHNGSEEDEYTTEAVKDNGDTKNADSDSGEESKKFKYINPLTGEGSEVDYSNKRPVAVMLNTIKQALPQSGNSKADILIEMTEEGGITRVMGIYQDLEGVGSIGAIRSTREYYYSWTQGFDAIMVHAGGDPWVLEQIKEDGDLSVDALRSAGTAFRRDAERLKYLSSEHTLFTSSDDLQNWLGTSGTPLTYTKDNYTKFNFSEDIPEDYMTGSAKSLTVTFSSYKSTTFNYNEESGKYDVFFWDTEPYMDSAANKQVEVTNIIVLPVPNWTAVDSIGVERQKYDLSGGEGYYINNGEYTKINWTKGDYNVVEQYGNPFNMTTPDGEPLVMSPGKTYICVMNEAFDVGIIG